MAEPDEDKPRVFKRTHRSHGDGGRQRRLPVRLSDDEYGALHRLAAERHSSIGQLLVESALASGAGETVSERRQFLAELFAVHRKLAAVSNNVNQIARVTNATGEWQAETAATLAAVRQTAERIDALCDELSLS